MDNYKAASIGNELFECNIRLSRPRSSPKTKIGNDDVVFGEIRLEVWICNSHFLCFSLNSVV